MNTAFEIVRGDKKTTTFLKLQKFSHIFRFSMIVKYFEKTATAARMPAQAELET